MKKPWSISTTVRNPERLRDFLKVLKILEGQPFNKNNQIKYQILLIQEKIYKPLNIPLEFRRFYEDPNLKISYKLAKKIFEAQNYEDPPMRGRQSVNPLNKLGFSIAREGYGNIIITELGNKFLEDDYDIGYIFFKSLLKLQFPNPWSSDFSEKENFNIMPFISVIQLIYKLNKKSSIKGLKKEEFCIFIPTLINYNQIDEYIEKILNFRKEKNKNKYILNFIREFYGSKSLLAKKIKNLYDYGDNIMRYFRFTRYFKVSMDSLGYNWNIDLEPSRIVEIEQLLCMYNGEAIKFDKTEDYLNYLSDITKPSLPWEKRENLEEIAKSIQRSILILLEKENLQISEIEKKILFDDIKIMNKIQLENYISYLRNLNLKIKERLKKLKFTTDKNKIKEIINTLRDIKKLRKFKPEEFEKLIVDSLKIINDEILIKPNYPVDEDGEPINYSPGNKPDIECYYKTFKAICEVTLNISRLQWVQEGQPIMRHLRNFENQNKNFHVFCIFIAPKIHNDTYSQFWISIKYEYDGLPQKIIPLTTEQFAFLLETHLKLQINNKNLNHQKLYDLYSMIIQESTKLMSFSQWATSIQRSLIEWHNKVI